MYTSTQPLIFIVDENEVYASMVSGFLKSKHYENTKVFTSVEEAMIEADDKPDVVICENLYNNFAGLDFMKRFRKQSLESKFIFLSSFENIDAVVNVMRNGAYDYIVKGKDSLNKLGRSLGNFNLVLSNKRIKKNINYAIYIVLTAILFLVGLIVLLTYLFPETFRL